MMDLKDVNECPDCASSNIVHNESREQIICRDCGLIYEPLTPEVERRFEAAHDIATRAKPRKTAKKPAKKAKKPAAKKAKKKRKK